MAQGNLPACLKITLVHEGGYVDHPKDPGGATNMGITHLTLAAWRGVSSVTKAAVKALTLAEATQIYDHRYWRPVRGDDLPHGIDLAVFDYAVNSGIGRAPKELQRVLGVTADGVIGPDTLKAAIMSDGKATIQKLCARRMTFLQGLAIWETFKRGWSRRVADVEAHAVAMWMARGGALDRVDRQALEDEAGKARGAAKQQNGAAQGAGAGGGAIGAGDAIASGEPNWLLIAGVVLIVGVIVIGLVAQARKNKARAAAYEAVAVGA